MNESYAAIMIVCDNSKIKKAEPVPLHETQSLKALRNSFACFLLILSGNDISHLPDLHVSPSVKVH